MPISDEWTNLADIVRSLHAASVQAKRMSDKATVTTPRVTDAIYRAYDYAGVGEEQASAAAARMLKAAQSVYATILELDKQLKEARSIAERALDAVYTADAQLKVARAKLGN
jgi:cell division septum initiation protein DivIVA